MSIYCNQILRHEGDTRGKKTSLVMHVISHSSTVLCMFPICRIMKRLPTHLTTALVHWHCPTEVKTQLGILSHYSGSALTMFGRAKSRWHSLWSRFEFRKVKAIQQLLSAVGNTTHPSGGQIRRCCSFEPRVSIPPFLQSQTGHCGTHSCMHGIGS